MQRFADLYRQLDETTSTNRKVAAMVDYFHSAEPADAAWAVYFLTGKRLKRLINTRELREWTAELSGLPLWLVEDSYEHVGDLAETMALLLPDDQVSDIRLPLHQWVAQRIRPLSQIKHEQQRKHAVIDLWHSLPVNQRLVLNKLLTGAFRVGVSRRLVTRALARVAGMDSTLIAHRLMGDWQASAEAYQQLIDPRETCFDSSTPYPFFLASPLESEPAELGDIDAWAAEWKWDGIRAQLIRRQDDCFIWSRGEDLMQGRFPELEAAASQLPNGCVLDGEILAWRDNQPLPFNVLQTRIGRKRPGPGTLQKAPVAFLTYDLLEYGGEDWRNRGWQQRRAQLEKLIQAAAQTQLRCSPIVAATSWEQLSEWHSQSRERGVEGYILKQRNSIYQVGRKRGDWWKWKIDPYTVDAVLIYAQPGHGRRSNLMTDYTFAVWHEQELVPFAKAYSGLTDQEIRELDRWIRSHTLERFGPVRSVDAMHVFELAFEGLNHSKRHKSGIAVRFPRILRWRRDLGIKDADTLTDIKRLLPPGTK